MTTGMAVTMTTFRSNCAPEAADVSAPGGMCGPARK